MLFKSNVPLVGSKRVYHWIKDEGFFWEIKFMKLKSLTSESIQCKFYISVIDKNLQHWNYIYFVVMDPFLSCMYSKQ